MTNEMIKNENAVEVATSAESKVEPKKNSNNNGKKNPATNTEKEKVAKNLEDLKAEIEKARKALEKSANRRNELASLGDYTKVEIEKANSKELAKTCAKACKDACFYELAFGKTPMISAIKEKSYIVYECKDVRDSETNTSECQVVSKEMFISLKEFDTYCTTHGRKGSLDKAWSGEFMALSGAIVAKLVLGFTDEVKKAETIKALREDYYFSKALEKHNVAIKDADKADPTSKTQIMKLGQDMVDHLVGNGYVFKVEDLNFIKANATAYDKRTQQTDVLKSRDMYNLNNKVFQHIVLGTPYELRAKKK